MAVLAADAEARGGRQQPDSGQLIVRFKPAAGADKKAMILAAVGGTRLDEIPQINAQLVQVPPGMDVASHAQALRDHPEVIGVERNRLVPQAELHPDDPFYAYQQMSAQVNVPQAWSLTTGSEGVTIAIVDGGVDASHPDLAPNMIPGWNFYDDDPDTDDFDGHGTKAAGTAAAIGNNGIGVAGVSWPSRIMPVGTSTPSSVGDFFAIADGLVWAADHGARVANVGYWLGDTTGSVVSAAAQYFQSRGGVVTSAAGNDGQYFDLPNDPYILTVGALSRTDTVTSWSNTGTHVDLVAPQESFTTIAGGGYGLAIGTSYSSAYVAGAAALILSVDPALTGAELQDLLIQSVDDLGPAGWDSEYGHGRLNVERAVAMAMGDPGGGPGGDSVAPSVHITSPEDQDSVQGITNIKATASDDVGVTRVEFFIDGQLVASDDKAPYVHRWSARRAASGPHGLSCKAYDAAGNVGTSPTVTVYR